MALGCEIKGFLPTSVIQGNPPLYEENSLWEALSVVSQKWPFPTALVSGVDRWELETLEFAVSEAGGSDVQGYSGFGLRSWA